MTEIHTEETTFASGDAALQCYVARPTEVQTAPAVLVLSELWGLNEHMRDICQRLARAGYLAAAPDLFRGQPAPLPDAPKEVWTRAFEAFLDERCILDCRNAVRWLQAGSAGLIPSAVFAWGFCLGGRFAHNLGAVSDRMAGVINFYGRVNFPRSVAKPFTPLDIAGLIDGPYLGVFAEHDELLPAADVAALKQRLAANPQAEIHVFPGTAHAFFNDQRPVYHAESAQRAWAMVLAFMWRHQDFSHARA